MNPSICRLLPLEVCEKTIGDEEDRTRQATYDHREYENRLIFLVFLSFASVACVGDT
jgi:hypothetical protein